MPSLLALLLLPLRVLAWAASRADRATDRAASASTESDGRAENIIRRLPFAEPPSLSVEHWSILRFLLLLLVLHVEPSPGFVEEEEAEEGGAVGMDRKAAAAWPNWPAW